MTDIVIKSSLIVIIAAICAAIFHRQSAAVRHAIWTVGLICALLVPVCPPLLPSWHMQLLPTPLSVPELPPVSSEQIAGATVVSPAPIFSAADLIFYVWLAGVVIAAAWLLVGISRLAWLALRAKPVRGDAWAPLSAGVAKALHLRRSIRLLQTERSRVMGAWGIFRGRVLLPPDAESWPEERIRVVLIHEFAHIKRNDWLIQIIAECARGLYWFNPLFWFMCGRLRRESEHACDDMVLGLGVDGKNYASHLLELARALNGTGAAWSAILAMAQRRHLERRFEAMLNPLLNHRPISAAMMIGIALVALGASLPFAAAGSPSPALKAAQTFPPEPPLPPPVPSSQFALPPAPPPPPPPPPPRVPAARRSQSAFGSLSGTAYDPSGAVIPGVEVVVMNLQTKVQQTVTSNAPGEFVFQGLPPGDYSLQAAFPGFATSRLGKITIIANQNVKQNVNLIVGNIIETVVVTAQGLPKSTLPPAGTPRRIRVGGNVQALHLINQVKPVYPSSALNSGIEGTVSLQTIIGADGTVQAIRVLGSIDPDLTAAAVEAVKQWRYSPTLLNGVPVETLSNIDVQFKQPQ